eukprot:GEMP01090120.1.p1 GENE.GEMP01090120.1~~GEMP01090120.1.p1  ORF type:complete len:109 (-),score=10.06 GEMP01090120.1:390-716(-)
MKITEKQLQHIYATEMDSLFIQVLHNNIFGTFGFIFLHENICLRGKQRAMKPSTMGIIFIVVNHRDLRPSVRAFGRSFKAIYLDSNYGFSYPERGPVFDGCGHPQLRR